MVGSVGPGFFDALIGGRTDSRSRFGNVPAAAGEGAGPMLHRTSWSCWEKLENPTNDPKVAANTLNLIPVAGV